MSLADHYTRFRVAERLLLTGHSHQAWPDVAREAVLEAYDDAALTVDEKWSRAFSRAERVREGFRALLGDPTGEIALGTNTHELLVRFLSALELPARPRVVTTDGEFHSARRQLARLAEAGLEVVRVSAAPVDTLADRLAEEVDGRTAAVVVSSVLFETSRIVPGLEHVASSCARAGAELLVDAYHQLGVAPFDIDSAGLGAAWVLGGGYKYLQLGEGNCFLRLPPHAEGLRPVVTGWYAEFGDLAQTPAGTVVYAQGAGAFAGSTYDPTSHYRGARVMDFFAEQGLTPDRLREISLHQRTVLTSAFDDLALPDAVVTRDRETPHATELQSRLRDRGVHTDSRGRFLRLGPAPYLSDAQLAEAVAILGEVAGQ